MKKIIYITDITLHSKEFRATPSLVKAEGKKCHGLPSPRLYSSATKLDATVGAVNPDGTFKFAIDLPADLQEAVRRGEIEIKPLHPEGVPIYPGKDLIEKMIQMRKKERHTLIHHGRVWRGN